MIIRSKRTQNFTVIPNLILNDSSLDWKELGLLVYLLSKHDDWTVSVTHLAKQRKAGRDAIYTMLKTLRDTGYVAMKNKAEGGVDYVIFDAPQQQPLTESTEVDKSHLPENPLRENPLTDNPTLIKTDKTIKTEKEVIKTEEKEKTPLSEWIEYRKEMKKPISDKAKEKLEEKFNNYTTEQQRLVVNHSIENDYRGLFFDKLEKFNGTRSNQAIPNQSQQPLGYTDRLKKFHSSTAGQS